MTTTRRIGVIGTFVWDAIHGWPPRTEPVQGWGGIAYALSGLDASLAGGWEIVPIIKVGTDLADRARHFLRTLKRVAADARLVEVPEPNNRNELRYYSADHRTEVLHGGVPPWTWQELGAVVADARLDALYVNFLSGWELDLPTARSLRTAFAGPMYVDLHMMLWVPQPSGLRELTPLPNARHWYRCFDVVQVNEEEMAALAPEPDPAMAPDTADRFADDVLRQGPACVVVTLGRAGARYFTAPGFERLHDLAGVRARAARGAATVAVIPPRSVREGPDIDPTGCGDVWGSTFFGRLLAGARVADAIVAANEAAGRNVDFHGASGLAQWLAPP